MVTEIIHAESKLVVCQMQHVRYFRKEKYVLVREKNYFRVDSNSGPQCTIESTLPLG